MKFFNKINSYASIFFNKITLCIYKFLSKITFQVFKFFNKFYIYIYKILYNIINIIIIFNILWVIISYISNINFFIIFKDKVLLLLNLILSSILYYEYKNIYLFIKLNYINIYIYLKFIIYKIINIIPLITNLIKFIILDIKNTITDLIIILTDGSWSKYKVKEDEKIVKLEITSLLFLTVSWAGTSIWFYFKERNQPQ